MARDLNTSSKKETVFDALLRGVREECGKPDFEPVAVYGGGFKKVEPVTKSTGKGDIICEIEPYSFVQQMGPPQPWIGPVFLVEVSADFEPDHSQSDGEAGEAMWWDPDDLKRAIVQDPSKFMGLHMPALLRVATKLADVNYHKGVDEYYAHNPTMA